jgi:hypothetical protein
VPVKSNEGYRFLVISMLATGNRDNRDMLNINMLKELKKLIICIGSRKASVSCVLSWCLAFFTNTYF